MTIDDLRQVSPILESSHGADQVMSKSSHKSVQVLVQLSQVVTHDVP